MPGANWGAGDWGAFDWGFGFALIRIYPQSPSFNNGQTIPVFVIIAEPAPYGGLQVNLASSDMRLHVPVSVTVLEGQTIGQFDIYSDSSPTYVATIYASLGSDPQHDPGNVQCQVTVLLFIPATPLAENPYRVVVEDISGGLIDEVPASNLMYSYVLNAAGQCTFSLPITHPKSTEAILTEGARQIVIYRNDIRVWGGYLWTIDASSDGVRCSCAGWLSRLALRYIDSNQDFVGADQFDIAWDLIDFTQLKTNGALGITPNYLPSGVVRTISYPGSQYTPILQAISDLAALDQGFDYEITPDKVWTPYFPKKGQIGQGTFDLQKNILGLSWTRDAQNMANAVTAIGGNSLISAQQDTFLQNYYGLLEVSTSWTDITNQAILDAHALTDLATMKISRDDPQMSVMTDDPPFGSYGTGDVVHISAHYGFLDIEGDYRIITIEDNVNNEGRDVVSLTFDTQVS